MVQIGSLHFVIARVTGRLPREQGAVLGYLKEENKVLREHLGDKRIHFTDAQRRRLARRGKAVGGRGLRELGCVVNPR